jgi:hypothetical protein
MCGSLGISDCVVSTETVGVFQAVSENWLQSCRAAVVQ